MKKTILGKFSAFALPGLILSVLGPSYAQAPGNMASSETGQSSMAFFLEKQDANASTGASLKAQLEALTNQYNTDPHAALRDQIREHEEYVRKLQTLRVEGQKMANPVVMPEFDLLVREAQDTTSILKSELIVRQHAPNPERTALKAQIDRLQKDLDWSTKVAKTLADQIKTVQDDHRYASLSVEIETLVKNSGNVGAAGTPTVDDLTSGKGK